LICNHVSICPITTREQTFRPEAETALVDLGITLRAPDIAITGADYEDGLAQGLDKLDPYVTSTWTTRKKTTTRSRLGLF
jgi:hypothetical protein